MAGGDPNLPDLPDTDEPHALLGVPAGAEPAEIRRAYARLIRTYKPDRAPEAFQRIRTAYEALRGGAPAPAPPPTPAPTPAPDAPAAPQVDEVRDDLLERGTRHLLDRDVDALLALVSSAEFSRLAVSDDDLADLARRAFCAACWDHPAEADRLFHTWGRGAGADTADCLLEEGFLEMRPLRAHMTAWRDAHPKVRPLYDYLRFYFALPTGPSLVLAAQMHEAILRAPAAHLVALDALGQPGREHVVRLCLSELEDAGEDLEAQLDAERSGGGPPSGVAAFNREANAALEAAPLTQRLYLVVAAAVLAAIGSAFALGWWSIPIALVLLITLALLVIRADSRLYARLLRPRVLDFVVGTVMAPEVLASHLEAGVESGDPITRFDDEIADDHAMMTLFAALRLGQFALRAPLMPLR